MRSRLHEAVAWFGQFQVETFFRLIDSDLMIPRKWMSKQPRKVEGQKRVTKYDLLGDNAEWWSLRKLYAKDQV